MTLHFGPARRSILSGGICAALLTACGKPADSDGQAASSNKTNDDPGFLPEATQDAIKFCAAATTLGEALLDRLLAETPEETVLVSPLAVLTLLAILGQAAGPETARELGAATGLQLPGLPLSSAGPAYESLQTQLSSVPSKLTPQPATVALANGIWVDRRAGLKPRFAKAQSKAFAASRNPSSR